MGFLLREGGRGTGLSRSSALHVLLNFARKGFQRPTNPRTDVHQRKPTTPRFSNPHLPLLPPPSIRLITRRCESPPNQLSPCPRTKGLTRRLGDIDMKRSCDSLVISRTLQLVSLRRNEVRPALTMSKFAVGPVRGGDVAVRMGEASVRACRGR